MIKLICFDLDGTINDNWSLFAPLRASLISLKMNHGTKMAIVTGRELLGTLYFLRNAMFPFDYIGCGGGPIIENPLSIEKVDGLFQDLNIKHIREGALSKTQRVLKIMELAGVSSKETLFIDDNDNDNVSADINEVSALLSCYLGSPKTSNPAWIGVLRARRDDAVISSLPCGQGTLQILEYFFPGG